MEDYHYTDPFRDMFRWTMVFLILFLIAIGVLIYVNYNESKDACDSFGGRLSGNMNCIKNGVSYSLETKSPLSLEKQVVRKAVDINDAKYEDDETWDIIAI